MNSSSFLIGSVTDSSDSVEELQNLFSRSMRISRPVSDFLSPPQTPTSPFSNFVQPGMDFFLAFGGGTNMVSPVRSPTLALPAVSPARFRSEAPKSIVPLSPRKVKAPTGAVWSGVLPARNGKESAFSNKVFLGGVPWDITDADLHRAFDIFGTLSIEWPGVHDRTNHNPPKGHVYILFDDEISVKRLLGSCNYDFHHGNHNWFYKVASKRMLTKSVQVIPWQLADATYTRPGCQAASANATGESKIFVANLHGMITAEGLASIMDQLFGNVIAASLDTDKSKYPIGSGRVTFNDEDSHMAAIRAATVDIKTAKFSRQIKIDPYLEDAMCSLCSRQGGPYFCRDLQCFKYFCENCWYWQHSDATLSHHTPMSRPARTQEFF